MKYLIYVKHRKMPFVCDCFITENYLGGVFLTITAYGKVFKINTKEIVCVVEQSEENIKDFGLALDVFNGRD